MELLRGGRLKVSDGTELGYLEVGKGPVAVFVHGGWGNASRLLAIARAMSDRYRCILLDRRRHGASDWGPALPYAGSLAREALDLKEVCEAFGPVAAVIGQSMGALIGLHTALVVQPGQIGALILYEPPVPMDGPVLGPYFEAYRAAIEAGEYEKALIDLLPFTGVTAEELQEMRKSPAWPELVDRALCEYAAIEAMEALPPGFERYAGIAVPTQLIVGSESQTNLIEMSYALEKTIAGAEVFLLEGYTHIANDLIPDRIADGIHAFVSRKAG